MSLFGKKSNRDLVLEEHGNILSTRGSMKIEKFEIIKGKSSYDTIYKFHIKFCNGTVGIFATSLYRYALTEYFNGIAYNYNEGFTVKFRLTKDEASTIKLMDSEFKSLTTKRGIDLPFDFFYVEFSNNVNEIYEDKDLVYIYINAFLQYIKSLSDDYDMFLQDEWINEIKTLKNIDELDDDMQYRFNILKNIEDNVAEIYRLSDENLKLRDKYYDSI